MKKTICFLIFPHTHLMDLSGPAQVFFEASQFAPAEYNIRFAGIRSSEHSEQGLLLAGLEPFRKVSLTKDDYIFVPGIDFKAFKSGKLNADIRSARDWLKANQREGVNIASVCSGSMILAEAGILDGRRCTTHWKCVDYLSARYPRVTVKTDMLFVKDENIYTSAGMTSGIDMALAILEQHHGPLLVARVAREIVVYLRRNDTDRQETIYLDYRTHFNPIIHKVQDYIISNPGKNPSLEELASIGNVSVRSLTRMFMKVTSHTIVQFKNDVKTELAKTLLHNEDFTTEKIASLCGFQSVRHLRRIWYKKTGVTLRPDRLDQPSRNR